MNSEFTRWDAVKAKRRHRGLVDEERLAAAGETRRHAVEAYRLGELRKRRSATQTDVAEVLGVTQGRISALESGEISRTEVETLRRYAEAIGGHLIIGVTFDDDPDREVLPLTLTSASRAAIHPSER